MRPVHLLAAVGCLLPAACLLPRPINSADLAKQREPFARKYGEDITRLGEGTRARIEGMLERLEQGEEPETYDILCLSGGGAFGAFGVGVLTGWGEIADGEAARPEFDMVSGISTGALIAPFAFAGDAESYADIEDVYRNPGRDWVRHRGVLQWFPNSRSLFNVSKLHDQIRASITPELLSKLAVGAVDGRRLLVGATNLDFGLLRAWSLADMARDDGAAAEAEIEDILIASSAIPGIFPPVTIDGHLYVDGGASLQFISGLEDRDWIARITPETSPFPKEGPPLRIRLWVIVNQKLLPETELVQNSWTSISARSLGILIRTSTLQSLQDLETYTRLMSGVPGLEAEFRYIAIPQDHPIAVTESMFDADVMRDLLELGKELGRDPASWSRKALRPAAPIESAPVEFP